MQQLQRRKNDSLGRSSFNVCVYFVFLRREMEQMIKTPEEMAQQYTSTIADTHSVKAACEKAFIAGYKAAQEHAHAALEEAEARMEEIKDQVAGVSKMVDVHGWISVRNRLPDHEREVFITDGLTVSAARYYQYGGWGVTLGRGNKYWMEKPELPEEK